MRRIGMAALLAAVVTMTGLGVQPAGGRAAITSVPPVPGRVAVAGDSLIIQSMTDGNALPRGWDATAKAGLGWQAENVQPRLDREVVRSYLSPQWLVVGLGSNDAGPGPYGDGTTSTDIAQLRRLVQTPHASARVVLIAPHRRGAPGSTRLREIDEWRAEIFRIGRSNPSRYCVTDFEGRYRANVRAWDRGDGTHLTPAGGAAYFAFMAESLRWCGGPG